MDNNRTFVRVLVLIRIVVSRWSRIEFDGFVISCEQALKREFVRGCGQEHFLPTEKENYHAKKRMACDAANVIVMQSLYSCLSKVRVMQLLKMRTYIVPYHFWIKKSWYFSTSMSFATARPKLD